MLLFRLLFSSGSRRRLAFAGYVDRLATPASAFFLSPLSSRSRLTKSTDICRFIPTCCGQILYNNMGCCFFCFVRVLVLEAGWHLHGRVIASLVLSPLLFGAVSAFVRCVYLFGSRSRLTLAVHISNAARAVLSAWCSLPVQFLSKAGVPTILCNGETAEFASLTTDERRLLVEFAREAFSGEALRFFWGRGLWPPTLRFLCSQSSQGRRFQGIVRCCGYFVLALPLCACRMEPKHV